MVARRAGISGCCLPERQPGYEKISSYYNLESDGIIQPVKQSLAELHKRSYINAFEVLWAQYWCT